MNHDDVEHAPAYEQDDGPFTETEMQNIRATTEKHRPTGQVIGRRSLQDVFDERNSTESDSETDLTS